MDKIVINSSSGYYYYIKIWPKFTALLFVFILSAVYNPIAQAQQPLENEVLLYSYFTGNGEDGLHLAYSRDGYHWQALNDGQSLLAPRVGGDKLMRDPCIIRGGDGNFHMVWTVSWGERGIGYASSKDLVNWSEQRFLPVMEHEKTTLNSWAPEITYDSENDRYMIYWASTIPGQFPSTDDEGDDEYNHRMYYTVTEDFQEFSDTELLYDRGFIVIDATIHQLENQYVMFLKDETRWPAEKNIRVAFGDQLTGPYSNPSQPITGDYWAEGPTAINLENRWIVYFDKYRQDQMGAVASTNLESWEDISDKVSFPEGMRHGTVFRVTEQEFNQLQKGLNN